MKLSYISALDFEGAAPQEVQTESWALCSFRDCPTVWLRGGPEQELTAVITQCCVEALYKLGKEHQRLIDLAKRFERRKCNHREAIEPNECLKDVIGESRVISKENHTRHPFLVKGAVCSNP
jgi:hypothetical protein